MSNAPDKTSKEIPVFERPLGSIASRADIITVNSAINIPSAATPPASCPASRVDSNNKETANTPMAAAIFNITFALMFC